MDQRLETELDELLEQDDTDTVDSPAQPCMKDWTPACESEGTHRIDVLVDGCSTRLTLWACEYHYLRAWMRWQKGKEQPPILYAWFRGKCRPAA